MLKYIVLVCFINVIDICSSTILSQTYKAIYGNDVKSTVTPEETLFGVTRAECGHHCNRNNACLGFNHFLHPSLSIYECDLIGSIIDRGENMSPSVGSRFYTSQGEHYCCWYVKGF